MKMRIRNWETLLAAGLILLVVARGSFADEAIPSDKRLPKNVVAYVSVKNVREFKSQWAKTLFGQMLEDAALADFRSDVVKQFEEASQQVSEHLGMSLSELLAIPQGEVAVAGVVRPGGLLAGVLLLDFGDQAEAVTKLLEKAAEAVEKNDVTRNEEEADDTKIISYQTKPTDGKDKPRDAGAYCIKETVLVVASDPATIKDVLTRWDGKHDRTLSDNETYQYILDKCREEGSESRPLLSWFFDPVSVIQALAASSPESLGQAGAVIGLFPTLGVDKLKGLGGVFEMGQGEFDSVSRTLVMLERSPQGIGNLFQFDLSVQSPPKWLSADWTSYMVINWNAAKAYSTVESFTDMFLGPGALAGQIQNLADNPASGNIHVKKDVIDQLAGPIHMATLDGEEGGKSARGTLVAVQIKKAAAVRATLAKIAGMGLAKIKEREFQGETLYEMEAPGADDDDDEPDEGTKYGLAVAEGHLMFATDVRLLERVLRGVGDAETLADSAAYKRIARRFPSKTAYISFSRQDTQMKSLFDMLKKSTSAGLLDGFDDLDFSKLPDADVLKKYLPPTGSYMEHDPKGLKITSFSLRSDSE
jgi:hypothetical protein